MKHIVTVLLIASLCAVGMLAIAEDVESDGSSEYGTTMSTLILQERSIFSGLVDETDKGMVITTTRGTYYLKGGDLDEFVGKRVRVTGIVRNGSIYTLKIYGEL